MRKYEYIWHHIPSNRAGFGAIWLPTRTAFRKRLRAWTQRGVWQFREA